MCKLPKGPCPNSNITNKMEGGKYKQRGEKKLSWNRNTQLQSNISLINKNRLQQPKKPNIVLLNNSPLIVKPVPNQGDAKAFSLKHNLQENSGDQARSKPSADELEIKTKYVTESDYEKIATAAKDGKFAISFRVAGEATIKQLNAGAGAKGHKILEKSIKQGSLSKIDDVNLRTVVNSKLDKDKIEQAIEVYLSRKYFSGMKGLVAHWKQNDDKTVSIIGLYLTALGKTYFESKEQKIEYINGCPIVMFSKNQESVFKDMQARQDWHSFFYTGDYDMHDMLDYATQKPNTVLADSKRENGIIATLNKKIGIVDENYKRVQHGPQYNYIQHNFIKERGASTIEAVAMMSLPVAMCDQGEWSILKKKEDLLKWYADKNVNIKAIWKDGLDGELARIRLIYDTQILDYMLCKVRTIDLGTLNRIFGKRQFTDALRLVLGEDSEYKNLKKPLFNFIERLKESYVMSIINKVKKSSNKEAFISFFKDKDIFSMINDEMIVIDLCFLYEHKLQEERCKTILKNIKWKQMYVIDKNMG